MDLESAINVYTYIHCVSQILELTLFCSGILGEQSELQFTKHHTVNSSVLVLVLVYTQEGSHGA